MEYVIVHLGSSIFTMSQVTLENVVSNSTYTVLKRNEQPSSSSREYDTAGWTFNTDQQEMSDLAFLPIFAIIILVLCSLLKAYQWSRESARLKARGDVEFSEETENCDVSNVGNIEFGPIDTRSDEASLYDTISSFRLLENGYAIQLNETHPYHDTVTSYKSLLMQKADGSQYDSVKSYKAFLQKVTQNKDLAVEVKLLENYPIRSKSAEHCVVLEEESSEKSGEATTKMLGSLPLNKQLHGNGKISQVDKKRPRHRRASGDAPSAMRKRSASNPTYCRRPVGSLPSIRCTISSDSEEDTQQSFRMDRKKLWAERRKMSRSTSGGKICKDPSSTVLSNGHGSSGVLNNQKRKRHFSADGIRRPKKAAVSLNKNSSNFVNNKADLKDTQMMRNNLINTMTKTTKPVDAQGEESSSENPVSSNSSDSDVLSDAVVSESDDDTKRNTLLSAASDDQTLDNDVFFSLDSGAELVSSSEILHSSPKRPLSETKVLIARAKEEFFKVKGHNTLMPPAIMVAQASAASVGDRNSSTQSDTTICISMNSVQTSSHDSHSTSVDVGTHLHSQHAPEPSVSQTESVYTITNPLISTGSHCASEEVKISTLENATIEENEESKSIPSPQRVQRFHVTFVNNDIPSLNSE